MTSARATVESTLAPATPLASWLHALAWLVARLPYRALATWGAAIGWIAGSLLRIRRAHVEGAMRRAGVASPTREARAMYRALGAGALELLWLSARSAQDAPLDDVAQLDRASRARWDAARAGGRGLVVAASHTGNWDLVACAMAREIELVVVTKHLRVQGLDAFWQKTRGARGVRLTEARGALAVGRAALARGGAVAMMIDQVPSSARHALRTEFLGAPVDVDRAPATLAARSGAPLVVTAARRDGEGRHVIEVLDVLQPPPHAGRAWIDHATRDATRALERFVLAHPGQWLWLHRRWRRAPPPRAACVDARALAARLARHA